MIVAVPLPTAVSLPVSEIVATFSSEEDHSKFLDAPAGVTTGQNVLDLPTGQLIAATVISRLFVR